MKKSSSVVTGDFDPGTATSGTGSSLQTTGEAAVVSGAASKSATPSVEGPGTEVAIQQNATQPVEGTGAGPEVC